jgi:glycosyltransferase involved in cell wall biosynthesis
MKRILLIGNSPLPTENTKSRPAAGLRTYQFLKPLIQEGGIVIDKAEHAFSSKKRQKFKVCLVTIALPECYDEKFEKKDLVYSEYYRHFSISKDDPGLHSEIQKIHDEFIPDAIVSVNTFASYVASSLNSVAPLWADLNGWIMAEAQAQAEKMRSNDYLSHYFEMESAVLKRADKISCVSDPQKYAVLGELSMIGRICAETFSYKFTYSIPNGTEFFEGEETANGQFTAVSENERGEGEREQKMERGGIPGDAFVLLWVGGYNTWVDEFTLFTGVSDAMEKCEKLYFVSTGGQISGLDNGTFSRFKKMIDESKFKNRFIFLGWIETADIPYIYARANAGINVDRKCVETYTGARNRINEMMKFGVPVITTLGSEISREVGK